jgi:RNA polymerase sigma-70 factor (ECF subfamily)
LAEAVIIASGYRSLRATLDDSALIQGLQKQDKAAFEVVFKTHYKNLRAYAFTITNDSAAADEVVQNLFFKLWERTESLTISGSIAAYLYRAVNNDSLNYLKHLNVRSQHRLFVRHRNEESTAGAITGMQLKELEAKLQQAMNELPEQCRTVFQLSRFEELRYREIADRLQISVKTVENHIGKALKILRTKLSDFLILVWLLLQFK